MDPNNARARLVDEARRLRGIAYRNSDPSSALYADAAAEPKELSCTGFVAIVFRRAFGDAAARVFIRDACTMWHERPGGLTAIPSGVALAGDLAVFTRTGDPAVDPRTGPNGAVQEWHVMLVSSPASMVIGVCSTLACVREVRLVEYTQLEDVRGRRWTIEGHLRPPGI